MMHQEVHQAQVMLLLAAAVGCVQVQDHALMLSNERSTIERTYELTKYLNHQLKEIKDTYHCAHLPLPRPRSCRAMESPTSIAAGLGRLSQPLSRGGDLRHQLTDLWLTKLIFPDNCR